MSPVVVVVLATAVAGQSAANTKAGLSNVAYEVRTTVAGDAIVLGGELTSGVANVFEAALAAAPRVQRVELDSVGGLIVEAERIAEAIRARKLDTHVKGICYSACTHVLLGGTRRTVDRRGKIGFHQAYTLADDEETPDESAPFAGIIARAFYEKAKLPPAFIARIFATPSARMWKPSRKELLDAGVLTAR